MLFAAKNPDSIDFISLAESSPVDQIKAPAHHIKGQYHIRSEKLPLMRPFLIMDMQIVEHAKSLPYLAADLDIYLLIKSKVGIAFAAKGYP